jgi:sugar phosphate permease
VVQLAGGLLIDRIPVRVMLATSLLLQAVVLVMAPVLQSVEMAFGLGVLMGMRGGFQMVVSNVVWANYFGRRHLGSITGVTSTLSVAGSALGPMPFGVGRDLLGSYEGILTGFAVLPFVLAFVTLFFAKRPRRET